MSKAQKKQRGAIADFFLRIFFFVIAVGLIMALIFTGINVYVRYQTNPYLLSEEDATKQGGFDCILVLGASVKNGDTPSPMLGDRLDKGIELYEMGCAPRLLMSGDHGSEYYNEVGVMKQYAVNSGVAPEVIFLDHAGFSTYESMYRATAVFGVKKMLIVTQGYHLPRAVYDARMLGIDAYGVSARNVKYGGQFVRNVREFLAIGKDFAMTIFKPEPKLLGAPISLEGKADDDGR